MYVYACVCTCMYVCMYVCMYAYEPDMVSTSQVIMCHPNTRPDRDASDSYTPNITPPQPKKKNQTRNMP